MIALTLWLIRKETNQNGNANIPCSSHVVVLCDLTKSGISDKKTRRKNHKLFWDTAWGGFLAFLKIEETFTLEVIGWLKLSQQFSGKLMYSSFFVGNMELIMEWWHLWFSSKCSRFRLCALLRYGQHSETPSPQSFGYVISCESC